ncbi:MAG: OmpA family protein [Alphaproteobacteria bacterium]
MKNSVTYKIFHLFIIPFLIAATPISIAHSEDAPPPTPEKRPDILHVSPAYIEELKALHNIESPPSVADIQPTAQTQEPVKKDETVVYGSGSSEVTDVSSKDIMNIINNNKAAPSTPNPMRKPGSTVAKIEPSAPQKEFPKESSPEKALVSFSIPAKQVKLDESLQNFLQTYALKLFNDNPDLNMEIHAYATPVEGEKHSDVRISLARALEVRSFLIDKKIAPSRLKLQPNGQDKSNSNDDRIDIIFIAPQ